MRFFFISLFISLQSFAKSKTCDPAIAYSDLPKAINDGVVQIKNKNDQNLSPTRDQDSVGHCYAYAAADLLENWMKKKNMMPAKENISALGLALVYKKDDYIAKAPEYAAAAMKKDLLAPKYKELQEKNKKLTDEISDLNKKLLETVSLQEKDMLNLKIQEQTKDLDFLNSVYSELEKQFYQEDHTIPEGGYPEVISSVWPLICYESEVNSRDEFLAEVLDAQYHSYSYYAESNTLLGLLNFLSIEPYVDKPNYCVMSDISLSIFPGLSGSNVDLYNVLLEVSKEPDLLYRLVKESCKDKKLGQSPKIISKYTNGNFPISNNAEAISNIDLALSKGKLSMITYRSQLLDQENLENTNEDDHASVIVGDGKICGEDFYILRNSWGKDACKDGQDTLQSTRDSVQKTKKNCELQAKNEAEFKFKNCKGNHCVKEKLKEKKRYYAECIESAGIVDMTFPKHLPYFCDEQGNYYIKKNYFKKYIYESATIAD